MDLPTIIVTKPGETLHFRPKMKRRADFQIMPAAKKRKTRTVNTNKQFTLTQSKNFSPELKAADSYIYGQAITSGTGSANHVMLMNSPLQGVERYQRIGRRIQIKSAHIRCSIYPVTPVPTSVPEDLVFMLVWDLEGGATPSLSSLLTDIDTSGTSSIGVLSHQNLDNSKRYKILKRKNIPLRICGTATGALPCNGAAFQAQSNDLTFEWNVKLNEITQFNSGSTGVVGDITNGALIFCWWTSLGAALPTSSFDVSGRIRYLD